MNLKNVAYSAEYLEMYNEKLRFICSENFKQDITVGFSPLCYLDEKRYFSVINGCNVWGSEMELKSQGVGHPLYHYLTINPPAHLNAFTHSNGQDYFLFHRDLYGYSVLNLHTMEEFHYFPKESFPVGETLIWFQSCYNPVNNMLAVSGCYRTTPPDKETGIHGHYSKLPTHIMFIDFTNPLQTPVQFVEMTEWLKDKSGKFWLDGWQEKDCCVRFHNGDLITNYVIKEAEYIQKFK